MNWAMTEKGCSQRRACGLVGIAPKTFRYVSTRLDDGELRGRLRTLADERRRFGYRRLHILLRREGVGINHKKLFRLYREERLTVRRRGGRKRALGTRAPMAIPQGPNQRWSTDFVQDVLTDGRRFRIWGLVDDFSRECLALVVETSISGRRVARALDRVIERRGQPCMIVSDNGTEFTSNAMLTWASDQGIEWRLHRAGQANAERLRRELQRQAPQRMPQRTPLPRSLGRAADPRSLAGRLQSRPPSHQPRRPHADGVRNPVQRGPDREQP